MHDSSQRNQPSGEPSVNKGQRQERSVQLLLFLPSSPTSWVPTVAQLQS